MQRQSPSSTFLNPFPLYSFPHFSSVMTSHPISFSVTFCVLVILLPGVVGNDFKKSFIYLLYFSILLDVSLTSISIFSFRKKTKHLSKPFYSKQFICRCRRKLKWCSSARRMPIIPSENVSNGSLFKRKQEQKDDIYIK